MVFVTQDFTKLTFHDVFLWDILYGKLLNECRSKDTSPENLNINI
jgi:hypothetical protein